MSDTNAPDLSGSKSEDVPVDARTQKEKWLNIAKNARTSKGGRAKNTTPVAKFDAQWKSMVDANYPFMQIRKFVESMLKAGDNVGEIYTVTPEIIVEILSDIPSNDGHDLVERYELLLKEILVAVRKFIVANSPESSGTPELTLSQEDMRFMEELREAKVSGNKAKLRALMKGYTEK